ncbi:MAG: formylglycine-generating enzyme family protein [Stigonema ocellatum SAG 48.90 = DSM 106950]|nr:formylglycine-generating enzyme family protein [Stigonema ocellatum SAG 48.90 = DSM 106950]
MVQINQSSDASDGSSIPTMADSKKNPSLSQNTESNTDSQIVEPVETAPVYDDSLPTQHSESVSTSGLPIKIADPLALRNALALERSLRPLMRKVPSLTQTVLDEEATVTSIAEEDFWLPVFQPVPSRWLEVALVIEETQRYPLWRQTLTEFQQLLERHGAFRNVSLWHLKIGVNGEVQLYSKNRQASLKELRDPSGRRLIWVVSDCVSPIWHDGSLLKVLRDWARVQPVSLLQLLPERLWSRTALGWGIEVQLYSENPGVPNSRLLKNLPSRETQLRNEQPLTLPIVTLESLPLKNWANVLAGVGGSRTPGLVFFPKEITPQVSFSDQEDKKLSAKARVSRFRAAASPLSRQLARMMAAAPVSLPVIRLIQKTLLPDSNAVHVAEVLMGGLLKPTAAEGKDGVTGEVNYKFYEGVREELIKITPKSKTFEVISCLSEFVNEELRLRRSVKNFEAMLLHRDVEIDPDYLPFAQITAQTLQLLGGKYADLGEQIQQKLPKSFEFEVVTVDAQGQIIKREQRQAQYYDENLGNGITLQMVAIPGGKFLMGSPEGEGYDSERPQHEVTVQPFFMGKYPVTQAQWRTVAALPRIDRDLKPDPSYFKGDNLPVEQVSWYDVVEFCARLSKASGKNYRLPSEAEWEYACRAGTVTPFHFGETLTSELANYDGSFTYREEAEGEYRRKTTPVGSFPGNAFGLFDMHGNVWEWCADWWNDNYDGSPIDGSAWLEKKNSGQEENENENDNQWLLRGGSWDDNPEDCRSAFRNRDAPDNALDLFGFRVVCVPPSRLL